MSGWFDEQLRARTAADEEAFSQAFKEISAPIIDAESEQTSTSAIEEIAGYFGVKLKPDELRRPSDLFKAGGVMYRKVELPEGWYHDASGVYLGKTTDGRDAALIPSRYGYSWKDYESGRRINLNANTQKQICREAVCFYRPLPAKKLGIMDLAAFVFKSLSAWDIAYIALITLAVTLVSMIAPALTQNIYKEVIFSGSYTALNAVIIFMIFAGISAAMLQVARLLAVSRIEIKSDAAVRAAVMMRIINLPVEFFRSYTSGELSYRASGVNMLCSLGANVIFSAGLSAVMSLIYLIQIFNFTPALVVPALVIVLVFFALTLSAMIMQSKILEQRMKLQSEESGMIYSFITGIQKIKLAGAERRAFSKWAVHAKHHIDLEFNPPLFLKLFPVLQPAVVLTGTFVLYLAAKGSGVSPADYMAFTASYSLLMGAFTGLCAVTMSMAAIRPILELVAPVLEAVPETAEGETDFTLRGGIEVDNLSFRYSEKLPLVLDNLSFKIRPGEYVAIVGRSGCGKSTLMRLLLGFESPEQGVIYYDAHNLKTLNIRELRKSIGCVMQNSRLFPGSIYQNIVITAPDLGEDDAWKAAELAGIADDIRKMPMQMNTMISEGSGTLSGGQVQRVVIARAVAPKPKILLFDEATSALDNITQKMVSESLDGLKCTRLVIAHRLSTVKHCDRILVLDGGKIAEEGTYDELIERGGIFAALVERQRLGISDTPEA